MGGATLLPYEDRLSSRGSGERRRRAGGGRGPSTVIGRPGSECLLSLGATRIDIGQSEVGRVAMADPEGNEFSVLTPR
ncbi:VOC family protein [Streptomyces sp. NPDC048639]|uniref:VOC family protein n=1 Tax=Streptomyces sp. NPDC048639 TaxID=3365581 RepID=UPI003715506A